MKMTRLRSVMGLMLLLAGTITTMGSAQGGLTGDEILLRVEEQEDMVMGGEIISIIHFENTYSDGTTTFNAFGVLGKQLEGELDKTLIYFKEPEDVQGTLFVSIDPEDGDSRLWLYLPALGQAKELVSEQQEQSFAGSTFSYREAGGGNTSDDYTAVLVGEETIRVGDQEIPCYLLELTERPDTDLDYPTEKMWVAKENWLTLKIESYNESGTLERTMEVLSLGEFGGMVVVDVSVAKDILEGNSTTITFLDRRHPEGEIPSEIFEPENLSAFDPSDWGFQD